MKKLLFTLGCVVLFLLLLPAFIQHPPSDHALEDHAVWSHPRAATASSKRIMTAIGTTI